MPTKTKGPTETNMVVKKSSLRMVILAPRE